MKRYVLGLVALLAAAPCAAQTQLSCGAAGTDTPGFSFYCRGKLVVRFQTTFDDAIGPSKKGVPVAKEPRNISVLIYYHAAAQAAGKNGLALQPGECAWEDRPLSSNENFPFVNVVPVRTNNASVLGAQVIAQCLRDSDCIVNGCAYTNKRLFEMWPWDVRIIPIQDVPAGSVPADSTYHPNTPVPRPK